MTKHIEKFDTKNLNDLRPVIDEALQVLEKYGLTASIGKITFGDTQFTAKLEVKTANNGQAEFVKYAKLFNLKPEWFGKTFDFKGTTYEIVGLDASKRKFPVVIRGNDGKTLGFTVDGIRTSLGDAKGVEQEHRKEFRDDFALHADGLNLNRAWLYQDIKLGESVYKLVGLDYRGRKPKVVFAAPDGQLRLGQVDWLLSTLKLKENNHLLAMKTVSLSDFMKAA
jgi:hypothetical protein